MRPLTFCVLVGILIPTSISGAQGLNQRAENNLVILGKLLGALRYFHPSDQAKQVNWDEFIPYAIDTVESIEDPEELALSLEELIYEIAPTATLWFGSVDDDLEVWSPPKESGELIGWSHLGLGADLAIPGSPPSRNIYQSERVVEPRDGSETSILPEDAAYRRDLGDGVCCHIPLVCFLDERGKTMPETDLPSHDSITDLRQIGLASSLTTWSVMQHFYPYFDVTDVDWEKALRVALSEANKVESLEELTPVLERQLAHIKDGHGRVFFPPSQIRRALPIALQFSGEDLLITAVSDGVKGVQLGDQIISINGEPTADLAQRIEARICSATQGWRDYRVATEIMALEGDDPVSFELQSPSGERREVLVDRVNSAPAMKKPKNGAELAPGILYYDLNRADWEDLQPRLETFAKAKGIVFDLRGYPGSAGSQILPHLSDQTLHSAWWNVPVYLRPDQEEVEFRRSHWTLRPKKPRLPQNTAFLTYGGAISYAESCMGIVEHYGLAHIVGESTAGSNGNINRAKTPSGHTLIWTGMKVTKHDDSQHHGVGILPTHPCRPTAEGLASGKDEVLEKAVSLLRDSE